MEPTPDQHPYKSGEIQTRAPRALIGRLWQARAEFAARNRIGWKIAVGLRVLKTGNTCDLHQSPQLASPFLTPFLRRIVRALRTTFTRSVLDDKKPGRRSSESTTAIDKIGNGGRTGPRLEELHE